VQNDLDRIEIREAVVGFHQDETGDWVADLACGHTRHVRHNPPWMNRPWVTTEDGRRARIGKLVRCRKCAEEVGLEAGADPTDFEI